MKTTYDITGDISWIGDMEEGKIWTIHECMKEYAREVLQEFIATQTDGEGCVTVWMNCGISTDQDQLNKFKERLK